MINDKYLSGYQASNYEGDIYKTWEDSGYFNPDKLPKIKNKDGTETDRKEKFSIVLPPPNVTGVLHVGHALEDTLHDIVIRFQRMKGKKTLLIPGTDHAAIATQTKVEKELAKKKIKKQDLGREEFLNQVNEFAMNSQSTILSQLKKMGLSADWSRLAFTLDKERNLAVKTTFKNMFADGIIYQDNKIINWDPKGQTVISDDEIVYQERKAMFYTFKYSNDFPISISTTRPETKVGDTAVAVHPDDKRYKDLIGKEFEIDNFAGAKLSIKIIADEYVDPEFGTGALGVTPAHSQSDWDIAERHNLEVKKVINEYAKMENAGELIDGLKVIPAREKVVEWLKENNLMEKEEEIDQNVSTAERTGGIIEPLPKIQWFINVNKKFKLKNSNINGLSTEKEISLKELMRTVVQNGQIKFISERFEKTYFHWIDKLHDWCISRQLWYGHQIPIWYKNKGLKNQEIYSGLEAPQGNDWVQEEDVLDTWFSSGLWTFSTLGWPNETQDLKDFHPTNLIMPGHEILFPWVARMILMSGYNLGEIPFETIYIHGLVRDEKNQKYSKSMGNALNPLDVIEEFGTDAMRIALVTGTTPGQDIKFGKDKIRSYSKFANKLWNIARFIYTNTENFDYENFDTSQLQENQKEKLRKLSEFKKDIENEYEKYNFHLSSEKIYHYVWHEVADKILEEVKNSVTSENPDKNNQYMLLKVLEESIKMLHPLMPFITEEIWKDFPKKDKDLLMVEKWD